MIKHEQKFCTELKKWLCHNFKETCFIEAKISLGNKPFNLKSGFKEHQIPILMMIKNGVFGYKISDLDRMTKPFDLIFSYRSNAYVAIHWVRKGNKKFYLITIARIQELIDTGFKSLTEKHAEAIAFEVGVLK